MTTIEPVEISTKVWRENAEWIKRNPHLAIRCYVRKDPSSGEIKIHLGRVADVNSPYAGYIPGWERLPEYPKMNQKEIRIPKWHADNPEELVIPIKWV